MRLLSKQEITQRKASDRKMEIDEGVKLARRVDGLREASAQEEANYKTVREQSARALKSEIEPLIEKRDELRNEVKDLEHQRRVAQLPLDAEWEKVRKESERVNELKYALADKADSLKQLAAEALKKSHELEIEEGRITDMKHTASQNLVESEKTLQNAQEEAADTRRLAHAKLDLADVREKETLKVRAIVSTDQEEVRMGREVNLKKEIELAKKDKVLKDRYATLERNLKRL